MSRTFFIVFARTDNEDIFKFTKSNIGMGDLGPNTNQVVVIEKTTCGLVKEDPSESSVLSWSLEIELIRVLLNFIEHNDSLTGASIYFKERLKILENALDKDVGGLINDVFLKNPVNNSSLKINLSFAFFDFDGYHNRASQADIYFTIASVINNLRHIDKGDKRIIQEEHIRTLLSPINFDRYDDGVIQASILRSATSNELNYKLDKSHSHAMMNFLLKMVGNHKDELTSEGLVEFLFALSVKKLKLHDLHLNQITELIDLEISNPVFRCFSAYLQKEIYRK